MVIEIVNFRLKSASSILNIHSRILHSSFFKMDEGIVISANEISGGDKLLVLSSAVGHADLYPLTLRSSPTTEFNKLRLPTSASQFPNTFTAKPKKRKNLKETCYTHRDKIVETVNKLRKLRAQSSHLFEKLVGKSLESKGIIDTYDDYTHYYMDKVSLVLGSFVNCSFDSEDTVAEVSPDLTVTIPAFSSMVDEFEFVRTSFEGIQKVNEASKYLGAYITRMLSRVMAVNSSFTVEFDTLLGRKVALSACFSNLSAPFVWVSTNLKKIGLTKEVQIHGLVRCTCSPDNRISSLMIYLDPSRLSEVFGSSEFKPL